MKLIAFIRYKIEDVDIKSVIETSESGNENLIKLEFAIEKLENDTMLFFLIKRAIKDKHMLTIVPLVYEYFLFIGPEQIRLKYVTHYLLLNLNMFFKM